MKTVTQSTPNLPATTGPRQGPKHENILLVNRSCKLYLRDGNTKKKKTLKVGAQGLQKTPDGVQGQRSWWGSGGQSPLKLDVIWSVFFSFLPFLFISFPISQPKWKQTSFSMTKSIILWTKDWSSKCLSKVHKVQNFGTKKQYRYLSLDQCLCGRGRVEREGEGEGLGRVGVKSTTRHPTNTESVYLIT